MIHNREFETVDIFCDVAITWTMFMHNFNFIWNMECMVCNQTLEVRRKEKQNNLGEKKSEIICKLFLPLQHFYQFALSFQLSFFQKYVTR